MLDDSAINPLCFAFRSSIAIKNACVKLEVLLEDSLLSLGADLFNYVVNVHCSAEITYWTHRIPYDSMAGYLRSWMFSSSNITSNVSVVST
jgi:hypothetical protein